MAKYFAPSGKAIQDVAVTPAVAVADMEPVPDLEEDAPDKPQTAPEPPRKPENDAALKKAIEILTKGMPPADLKTQSQSQNPNTTMPRGPMRTPRLPR